VQCQCREQHIMCLHLNHFTLKLKVLILLNCCQTFLKVSLLRICWCITMLKTFNYFTTWNFHNMFILLFWRASVLKQLNSVILWKFVLLIILTSRFWVAHSLFPWQCYFTRSLNLGNQFYQRYNNIKITKNAMTGLYVNSKIRWVTWFSRHDMFTTLSVCVTLISYLRNRKHVLCFYPVRETRVKVWENKKCCGNTSHSQVFPQLFQVLPIFTNVSLTQKKHEKMFSISFRKHRDKKRKTTC